MMSSTVSQLFDKVADLSLYAQSALIAANGNILDGVQDATPRDAENKPTVPTNLNNEFSDIANILIYLTGALAVIVLIYGGLRYVTSTGDAVRVKAAKDTILYGIIGVVVAILAYALVNFVIDSFN